MLNNILRRNSVAIFLNTAHSNRKPIPAMQEEPLQKVDQAIERTTESSPPLPVRYNIFFLPGSTNNCSEKKEASGLNNAVNTSQTRHPLLSSIRIKRQAPSPLVFDKITSK